eukprot:scaffold12564_cov60-Attheya_sp.AAC.4
MDGRMDGYIYCVASAPIFLLNNSLRNSIPVVAIDAIPADTMVGLVPVHRAKAPMVALVANPIPVNRVPRQRTWRIRSNRFFS